MKIKKFLIILLAAAALALNGCGSDTASQVVSMQSSAAEQSEASAEKDLQSSAEKKSGTAAGNSPGSSADSSFEASQAGEYDAFRKEKLFVSDLPEEDLEKPSEEIGSLEDMIYALDYLAFYRIGDEVFFHIDDAFAEEIYNPYTVYQEAYLRADLADVYACRMDDSYYSEFGVIGLKYSMSRDIATEAPDEISKTPVLPSFDYGNLTETGETAFYTDGEEETAENRGSAETVFNVDDEEGSAEKRGSEKTAFYTDDEERTAIHCENGEQLYYLAMNGYRPLPEPDSIAQELYESAGDILCGLVSEEMNDFQKIKAVYDWLTTEVRYDAATAYSAETYLVKEQAYYLEGVFFNRCAVCDGKAKACALLLNMLGIPCYRTTGVNEGGDHAWNMVQYKGGWYVLCTTYGQADMTESLGRIVPNYSMLLTGAETPYDWYPADKHPDIEEQLQESPCDLFAEMGEADDMSLKAADIQEVETLLKNAENCGKSEYKIEFEYTGENKEDFTEDLKEYFGGREGYNAAEVRKQNGTAFQIFVTETDA